MDAVICNAAGIKLIKFFEGLGDGDKNTPDLEVYFDPVGIATLGYGSCFGIDGHRVDFFHRPISLDEAEGLLVRDIGRVEQQLARLVRVDLSANEWAATVSLVYNIGSYNYQCSTHRMRLNRNDKQGAAAEFPKWRLAGRPKRILPGLVIRRAAEQVLFLEK